MAHFFHKSDEPLGRSLESLLRFLSLRMTSPDLSPPSPGYIVMIKEYPWNFDVVPQDQQPSITDMKLDIIIFRAIRPELKDTCYAWDKYSRTLPCGHPTYLDTSPLWTLFPELDQWALLSDFEKMVYYLNYRPECTEVADFAVFASYIARILKSINHVSLRITKLRLTFYKIIWMPP